MLSDDCGVEVGCGIVVDVAEVYRSVLTGDCGVEVGCGIAVDVTEMPYTLS